MSRQSEANNREKSLGENLIIIVLVASLMAVFLFYFFKQEQRISQAGFNIAASNFSAKVVAIRAQWFMEKQPRRLIIKEKDGSQLAVALNKKGWLDFGVAGANCRKIWQALMSSDFTFINQPVAVIGVNDEISPINNHCRYRLPTGEYFDYFAQTGQVVSSGAKQ